MKREDWHPNVMSVLLHTYKNNETIIFKHHAVCVRPWCCAGTNSRIRMV